jgi:hypothetical protein
MSTFCSDERGVFRSWNEIFLAFESVHGLYESEVQRAGGVPAF